ncbi:MAG: rhodanese-like domain-containing protein [Burkholderiales bacterium]|jgi:rhodanese-related sulfurtransferase|nr:rhodanese-like domain-containing protein [Burkholderiales bacterium]
MEFLQFLQRNWMMALICVVSGVLLFLWPMIQRRFSPSAGVSTLAATRLINAGSLIILDVRNETEYAAGHLNRAINIPLNQLQARVKELEKKSAKNILVYCDRGQRSLAAAKTLAPLGKAIHNLQGGIAAWQEANLPIETGSGDSKENVVAKENRSGGKKSKKAKKRNGNEVKSSAQENDAAASDKTSDQPEPSDETVAALNDETQKEK